MQSYHIHYPSIYPNCASQRPIYDNMVKKDINCSKEYEKGMEQDSKYLKSRWCPSGLSHTQKEDYNVCAIRNQWSNELRSCRQGQQLQRRYGSQSKLFGRQLELEQVMADSFLSPLV